MGTLLCIILSIYGAMEGKNRGDTYLEALEKEIRDYRTWKILFFFFLCDVLNLVAILYITK